MYDGEEETVDQIVMSFLQADTITPGSAGVLHENINCFLCSKMVHYASVGTESGTEDSVQILPIHTSHAYEEEYFSHFQFL